MLNPQALWKCRIVLALLMVTTAVSRATASSCPALPGSEQLLSDKSLHWILVGELHGTNETPAAFADLVCNALSRGKHVDVGLERPIAEQADIDQVMTATDVHAAEKQLLAQLGWREQGVDGRASTAMLHLLEYLRELRSQFYGVGVYAFDVPYSGSSPGARDEAIGREWLRIHEQHPQDVILILTGNAHVFKAAKFGFNPAATYLPQAGRISLEVTSNGGEIWASFGDGMCGVRNSAVISTRGNLPRRIILDPQLAPYGKVDGILSLGEPTTPSTPAVGELSPLPPCRQRDVANKPK